MNLIRVTAFSLVLVLPGLSYGMGFNPFKSGSDNPPPPHPSHLNSVVMNPETKSVPLPGTALAFGLGFLGLAAWKRYRRS